MLVTVDQGEIGRSRVWLGELPPADYAAVEMLERVVETAGTTLDGPRSAAREWTGGELGQPSSFGLLGARFTPATTAGVVVQVAVAARDDGNDPEATTLAPLSTATQIGIPFLWEARAVLEGAAGAAALPALGPGTLVFSCALYGHATSSPVVYRWLADSVVRLLTLPPDVTERDVEHAVSEAPSIKRYWQELQEAGILGTSAELP